MSLKPQSIKNNIQIFVNNQLVEKQEILDISTSWSPFQEDFFKKMLQQGGKFKINNVSYNIVIQEKLLNSKGEKERKVIKSPSIEDRI